MTVHDVYPSNELLKHNFCKSTLAQFILDPTSFNLPNSIRFPIKHPGLDKVLFVVRDWCYAIAKSRKRQLTVVL